MPTPQKEQIVQEMTEKFGKAQSVFLVDFTGIDIGLWNRKYITIELNSSPTIGEYWAGLIANILINKYRER